MIYDSERERRIIFLGGIFASEQQDLILENSRGVVQSAADALQKNIVSGIASHGREITIVNLPFIGSYPNYFGLRWFPSVEGEFRGVRLKGRGFCPIRIVKPISRMYSAFRGLISERGNRPPIILVYSAHSPFILAALAFRLFIKRSRVCVILPDLPEFMGEGGRVYTLMKAVESRIFYNLVRYVDGFVLLTNFMAEKINIRDDQYTVVEGIADDQGSLNVSQPLSHPERRVFLYTGTLAARYGIVDLVKAFTHVKNQHVELWICGEGDGREEVEKAAKKDKRLRYFGQVSREKARELQVEATILVNPRSPEGEYTKYSFPSKTMEYMASGRPVLMHRLPGMPNEYLEYIVCPEGTDVGSLASAMENMASWPSDRLSSFGNEARLFILSKKGAYAQCAKIIKLLDSLT